MDPKLKAILQKAKAIDIQARKYDSVDNTTLLNNVNSRAGTSTTNDNGLYEQMGNPQEVTTQSKPMINSGNDDYNQRVRDSKLPPEIIQSMLDNPIPQPDMPGTFSMDEETIKDINPDYGKRKLNESRPKQNEPLNNGVIRKMIAEEIAKALPSIVEKYFDKQLIKENVNILKSLKIRPKRKQ